MSHQDAHIDSRTDATGATFGDAKAVRESVQTYYGKVLGKSSDLKTSACTSSGPTPATVLRALTKVPEVVKEKFYGCGNPIPDGIEGLTVLDLGCGSGRDCFIAAIFVGKQGKVIGLDMTPEQIVVAKDNDQAFHLMNPNAGECVWKTGYIENIIGSGVDKDSCDLVISNCVVNLSPDKPAVLQGAFDALKEGGEFYFSDVYVDRRLPEEVRTHEVLFGECLSGALYDRDFHNMSVGIGFAPPKILKKAPIDVHDASLRAILGNANFYSITYRLFKLPKDQVDPDEEDFGQIATYNGGVPGHQLSYELDQSTTFEIHRPRLVSGNTASILKNSWLAKYFTVMGDRSRHFGAFAVAAKNVVGSMSSGNPELPAPPLEDLTPEEAACCASS